LCLTLLTVMQQQLLLVLRQLLPVPPSGNLAGSAGGGRGAGRERFSQSRIYSLLGPLASWLATVFSDHVRDCPFAAWLAAVNNRSRLEFESSPHAFQQTQFSMCFRAAALTSNINGGVGGDARRE
jgi:hypothetical protein